MVKPEEWCWHCIHPEFLRDQLTRSRERLRLETLDVCLLHNPEYFFTEAKKHGGGDLDVLRGEFYRRVREAFAFFEAAVAGGEIGCYGVSSNTLVAAADDPEATSVTWFLKAAEEAGGGDHHFRVLQFPMNLFESGGALLVNTGPERGQTPLEAAAAAGLGVLINRPLNAIVANRLIRLAEVDVGAEGGGIAAHRLALEALEKEFRARVAPAVGIPRDAIDPFFDLIDELAILPGRIEDLEHWRQIEQQHVIPRINHTARAMAQNVSEDHQPLWLGWWQRCVPSLEGLLQAIAHEASRRSRSRSGKVAEAMDPLLPEERRGETLSRKALWVLAGTPGVTGVLVGMRQPSYVKDAIEILSWPPLRDPLRVYRRVRQVGAK
jgi:aryl-alcohol dehydrogenase-like predicted oxidoreductase